MTSLPMRTIFALASALGVVAVLAPALAEEDVEMIVDGTPAPEGKYQYQVRLYDSFEDEKGSCGGSLIDAQWVLTAAHCLYRGASDTKRAIEPGEVVIGYGSTDREATTKVAVSEIHVHPTYAACEGDTACADAAKADIALLKLEKPVDGPRPWRWPIRRPKRRCSPPAPRSWSPAGAPCGTPTTRTSPNC
ncbi:hypothetical protein AUC71_10715 [Methyloceanibacter marginalis]|uniref:Peptidase S1 domain-containing protein n=1 Tax=Methyloceanibacter marginalis TaxID=1774971 RepID=A0A1E3WBS3_9HYPH|nr:hypothetical protein AUC71_10715 [Methyloceanibacter marginalis]